MNITYVAIRNLRRKSARTWLLFAIVAIVSCTLFTSALFLRSIANALSIGSHRLGADILVVPASAETKARSALLSGEPTHFLMEKTALDRVRAVEGVKAATPQLFIKPAGLACCFNVDAFLIAYEPSSDFTVKPWLERNLKRAPGPAEVITGRGIPAMEGDAIPFFGTNFTVIGTMEPTGMDFFDRAVFMSMEAAYLMAENSALRSPQPVVIGRDKISTVLVQVREGLSPDLVAIRIEHDLQGSKAISADTVISSIRRQLSGLVRIVVLFSTVLWIIMLLVMAFAFTMIVNERRRELGLLRAMGATKAQILSLILTEAATLSAGGGAAGTLFGFAWLAAFKGLLLHYLALPYLFPSPSDLLMQAFAALAVAVMTGMLAAFLPMRNLLLTEPYEAIRSGE